MSSRCSTAPVAASPASFQPSNATTATASVSRGRSSEVGLGSVTLPSLRRTADIPRVAGTNLADGGKGSLDRWIRRGRCPSGGGSGTMAAGVGGGRGGAGGGSETMAAEGRGRRGACPPVGVPEPWRPTPQWTLPARRPRTAMPDTPTRPDVTAELTAALRRRILVLDGATGTAIQRHRPSEETYRGERFADWP